jgi:adenine-specific DNA-methyltransferase
MGYRYIGSKDKLASTLIAEIKHKCPDAHSVIDLMAGTGLFSLALRREGYRVIASDVMTYSYHHLVVNLTLNSAPKFDGLKDLLSPGNNTYERVLEFLNQLQPELGFFTKEYSPGGSPIAGCKPRMYFTTENAAKIDAIRKKIREWHEYNLINDVEHSLLLHDLIMAANDIANIAGTYGHYLSHFVQRSTDPIQLSPSVFEVDDNTVGHEIRRGYAEEISPMLTGDVCYIDPPYIKRQYAANYHILETLAREDEPEAIGESGLRPWRDQYSNFCSKIRIRSAFDLIIRNIHCSKIFISYSEDGLLPINDLMDFLRQYGIVELSEIRYKRFRSNNSQKELELTEYLIYLHKGQEV